MARDGFTLHGLDEYADGLISASKNAKGIEKKMLRKAGNELKRKVKAAVRVKNVKGHTGVYVKSIKRGKVWLASDGSNQIRVYSNAPHAHLIEEGHDQTVNPGKGKGGGHGVKPGKGIGRKVGEVPGREVFQYAADGFEAEFERYCAECVDEIIREIGL